MPQRSRWSVDIPIRSLPSLLLGDPGEPLPDTLAYADTEDPEHLKLSWQEFGLWCKRFAAGLIDAGLLPGDRVLVYSGNSIFFPVVTLGVIMADGIISTANPAFVARELAYQLKDSGARFLLVTQNSLDCALDAATLASFIHDDIFIFDDTLLGGQGRSTTAGKVRHWGSLVASPEKGRNYRWKEMNSREQAQQTLALLYSSGTTGVPKGVELTHYGLVANCVQLGNLYSLDPKKHHPQRLLAFLPMYHGLGLLTFTTMAPYRRLPTYIMKRFSLQPMLRNIERFQITELNLVPPILVAMAKSKEAKQGKYNLGSVQKVTVGAAPLSREMCAELEKLWPDGRINVKQGWGMTELPISTLNWDEREISKTQAVGEPVANCSVKIMDEDGVTEVTPGQPGELWCKTPTMMKGYWKKPKETQETITADGWLKTGDIAYADGTGKYVIVDRKKELIKVKGNQVAPAELEGLLLEHPHVQDAAVVGIKRDEDEEPRAYVIKKSGSHVSAEDLLDYMAERTAKIKRITGGIIFCDTIPKNPSGKILRRVLRERAAKEVNGWSVSDTGSSVRARL